MQKSKRWSLWRGLLAVVLILSMVWSNGAAYAFASSLEVADTQTLRVLVISIDPEINNPTVNDPGSIFYGREKLLATEYLGFSLEESVASLKSQIERGSHHTVAIEVVETMWCNEFPVYNGYDSMTEEVFLELFYPNSWGVGEWYGWWSRNAGGKYIPEELDGGFNFDYQHLLDECNLVEKKNNDEFDAVWVFSIDPSSMYEFNMVGRNPLWLNGATIQADCDNFALGGLTFSRRDGAIESFGHASESMLNHSFGTYLYYGTKLDFADFDEWNMWQKFYYSKSSATEEDKASEDTVYGVGNVHFSPNSEYDYDWSNNTPVYSYYEEFANGYPNIDGTPSIFTAESAYLGTEEDPCRSHHVWWFGLMPHYKGRDEDGYSNNWWDYLLDTKYVTRLSKNKTKTIKLTMGDYLTELDYVIQYHSGETEVADALVSEAYLEPAADGILVREENGLILAKAAGTSTLTLRYDGKELVYAVEVAEPDYSQLNGLATGADGKLAYYVNGKVDTTMNGLLYNEPTWYYLTDGYVNYDYCGLVSNDAGTWYVKNGVIDFTYTDLFCAADAWYYVMDGRVTTEYTGLVTNSAGVWYVEGGKINQSYTGLVCDATGWWYVMDGRVTTEYTGLVSNEEGLWYVENGMINWNHTGLVSDITGWYYVLDGRVTLEYTGLVTNSEGVWYLEGGKINQSYTGLVCDITGWWYVMDGRVTTEYTGLATNENGTWYVENGSISFAHEGLICDATGWWYVISSQVATGYTGLATNEAGTWYVQNGFLDFGFSGEVTIGEAAYTVVGGQVQ